MRCAGLPSQIEGEPVTTNGTLAWRKAGRTEIARAAMRSGVDVDVAVTTPDRIRLPIRLMNLSAILAFCSDAL